MREAGVFSHSRAERIINIRKVALTWGAIYFYVMADLICRLLSGDDYKVVFVNNEGTDSAIKPQIVAVTPACKSQGALHVEMPVRGAYRDVSVFVQLQSSMSGSRFVVRINACTSAFPHTNNRLFSSCHFHLRSPIKSLLAFPMLMPASWLQVSPWNPDRCYFQ